MHTERLALHAMATRFELVLEGPRAAGEAALEVVERCDERYSLFRSDSFLARINRTAFEEPVRVDGEMFELLEACAAFREATDGAFDVCVGPWMRARGFRGVAPVGELADRGTFELDASARTVRFTTANTAIDLGGIAKGHALELAAARLRECGVESAFLHGGTSSAIAIGAPPGELAWRVAIGSDDGAPVAVLRDSALSVSAPRGRTVERAGRLAGHVLDPLDGRSIELTSTAAVVDASARTAEAWSTALLVLAARSRELPRAVRELRYVHRRDSASEWIAADRNSSTFESGSPTPR